MFCKKVKQENERLKNELSIVKRANIELVDSNKILKDEMESFRKKKESLLKDIRVLREDILKATIDKIDLEVTKSAIGTQNELMYRILSKEFTKKEREEAKREFIVIDCLSHLDEEPIEVLKECGKDIDKLEAKVAGSERYLAYYPNKKAKSKFKLRVNGKFTSLKEVKEMFAKGGLTLDADGLSNKEIKSVLDYISDPKIKFEPSGIYRYYSMSGGDVNVKFYHIRKSEDKNILTVSK